jgi:hypothetical protein
MEPEFKSQAAVKAHVLNEPSIGIKVEINWLQVGVFAVVFLLIGFFFGRMSKR